MDKGPDQISPIITNLDNFHDEFGHRKKISLTVTKPISAPRGCWQLCMLEECKGRWGARGGCMGKLGPQEGGAMGKLGRLVVVQCMQFVDHFFPDVPMACAM